MTPRAIPAVLALLALGPALGGCAGAAIYGGVEGASVVVFGKGLLDIGVSAVTGRDCSVVRLDRGTTYCAPREVLVAAPFCTRTLGTVECWADPDRLTPRPQPVASAPDQTPEQVREAQARWPKSLNLAE